MGRGVFRVPKIVPGARAPPWKGTFKEVSSYDLHPPRWLSPFWNQDLWHGRDVSGVHGREGILWFYLVGDLQAMVHGLKG